jgi:hypothetical protein
MWHQHQLWIPKHDWHTPLLYGLPPMQWLGLLGSFLLCSHIWCTGGGDSQDAFCWIWNWWHTMSLTTAPSSGMPRQHYQLNIPLHEALLVLWTREPKHHAPSQIGSHNLQECAASIFRTEERWSHHIPLENSHLSTNIHTWHTSLQTVVVPALPQEHPISLAVSISYMVMQTKRDQLL